MIGTFSYYITLIKSFLAYHTITEEHMDAPALEHSELGQMHSNVIIVYMVIFIGQILIFTALSILFFIGVFFITQGTANQNFVKDKDYDLDHKKIVSRNIFLISFALISIMALLFFKPATGDFYGEKFGIEFGFPFVYMSFLDSLLINFNFISIFLNISVAVLVSYGTKLIYERLIA